MSAVLVPLFLAVFAAIVAMVAARVGIAHAKRVRVERDEEEAWAENAFRDAAIRAMPSFPYATGASFIGFAGAPVTYTPPPSSAFSYFGSDPLDEGES